MGLDISALFGKAEDAAKQGMNDLLKSGGNAAIGYLEKQAVGVIQQDQANHEQAAQDSVNEILNRPGSSPFSEYLTSVMQAPVMQNYGGYLLVGVGVVLLIGMRLR